MLSFQIRMEEGTLALAVLLRVSLVLFLLPPFGSSRVPVRFKAGLAFALTAFLFPLLRLQLAAVPLRLETLVILVTGELLLAMLFALALMLVLSAFELAGDCISHQTGLAFAQVVDPQAGAQTTIFSNLLQILGLLLFLSINGHHLLLKTLLESFRTLPVGQFAMSSRTLGDILLLAGQVFVIGIQLAAPPMVVLLLCQVSLGMISRFVPGINILVTSFPITILLGLLFVAFSLPLLNSAMKDAFRELFLLLQTFVKLR
jgi:flagellar biosynthetic protein FliR